MTPTEINAAIATWMGWTNVRTVECDALNDDSLDIQIGVKPGGADFDTVEIPNYHGDLNACADFEAHLADNYESYVDSLFNVHHRDGEVLGVVSCSAPQRCEALLRVLNLWKE